MAETRLRRVSIARQSFELRRDRVEVAMRDVFPEPVLSHFVVIDGRRYPPKQVISQIAGLDRADFTTHHARRVLMRLGFPVGRRASVPKPIGPHEDGSESRGAEALRGLAGQWVAMKGDHVLIAAGSPAEVVGWLSQHGVQADSMFRVPEDELAASGLAPW